MPEMQVRRDNFTQHRVVDTPERSADDIAEGEILVRIDRFSFTANNVTYAAAGDMLGYWQFFPPADNAGEDGWGITPVWGFADVIASKADTVPVGERLYGYFPPATTLTMTPVKVGPQRLFDGAAHRAKLPPGYNSYSRVHAEPGYDASMDNLRALLWPLHVTSFCLHDVLQSRDWFGARQVLILSASSKTSLGLACGLHDDGDAPTVVGLTSPRNQAFVEHNGYYDAAFSYDALGELDATLPTVIVDMSGNADLLGGLFEKFGDQLTHCINVGMTHWDERKPDPRVDQARCEFFFAPGHIQQRMKDWGVDGFADKSAAFLRKTATSSANWLTVRPLDGLADLATVYSDVCSGQLPAEQGLIVVM